MCLDGGSTPPSSTGEMMIHFPFFLPFDDEPIWPHVGVFKASGGPYFAAKFPQIL